MKHILVSLLFLFCSVSPLLAGEVDVINVTIGLENADTYGFHAHRMPPTSDDSLDIQKNFCHCVGSTLHVSAL
jgi:hypothetical protein